jgi:hypothetical protein
VSPVRTGACECGAIRYERSAEPIMAAHCHCRSCQKASNAGHGSHLRVPKAAVRGPLLRAHGRQCNRVRRRFCPNCGAPVYAENAGRPDTLMLRAGSLDDPELFRPAMIVYAEGAPSWDHLDPALPSVPRMPER